MSSWNDDAGRFRPYRRPWWRDWRREFCRGAAWGLLAGLLLGWEARRPAQDWREGL